MMYIDVWIYTHVDLRVFDYIHDVSVYIYVYIYVLLYTYDI